MEQFVLLQKAAQKLLSKQQHLSILNAANTQFPLGLGLCQLF